ncbi:type IV pilin protein [Polaromonas sp. YR568]|uniref:type IV pilin protein n=1 Tax=Polaromonas sp. YR568 TaxID=1855301 RepID=UPI00398BD402
MSTPTKPRGRAGFTLIELLIVLAILALLAAIALPSYWAYAARAHRAAARVQLLQAAQYMQRFYAANDRYDADRTGTQSVWAVMPPGLQRSPADGTQLYALATTGANASTAGTSAFMLVMLPLAGRAMDNDRCGGFTITQAGAKGLTTASPGAALLAECWR